MRLIHFAAFLALLSGSAEAAELQVLTPPVVYNAGLKELADDFTKQTGTKVTLKVGELLKIPNMVHDQATDVFFLETDLMTALAPGDRAAPCRWKS